VKKFVIPPDEILDKMARVMNCIILAGGLGTRISEESGSRPKPMVEIGGKPVLWHVMKIYSAHGIRDFIICTGYKGYVIKEYFANYFLHMSDVTFDMQNNSMEVHQRNAEPWKVTVVDTGEATMTGGRLKRVQSYIPKETFCMTYGDGVGNVDITAVIKAHRGAGKKATVTAVQPPGRFGAMHVEGNAVTHFVEKPEGDGGSRWTQCAIGNTSKSFGPQVSLLGKIGDIAKRFSREARLAEWSHWVQGVMAFRVASSTWSRCSRLCFGSRHSSRSL
jgi:glucose-1-phosphate cytidylyltransferase